MLHRARALLAASLLAGALLVSPGAAGAQERPSDPNGCEQTPSAEGCQGPGNCENTPGAEHCQGHGRGRSNDTDVLGATVERPASTGGSGLLSLPRTGFGIATLVLLATAAIAAGVGLRRSASRA